MTPPPPPPTDAAAAPVPTGPAPCVQSPAQLPLQTLTLGATIQSMCTAVGLDPSVALIAPPWFNGALLSMVATSAVRPPTHSYQTSLEQHLRSDAGRPRLFFAVGSVHTTSTNPSNTPWLVELCLRLGWLRISCISPKTARATTRQPQHSESGTGSQSTAPRARRRTQVSTRATFVHDLARRGQSINASSKSAGRGPADTQDRRAR